MDNDQYTSLLELVEKTQNTVNRLEANWDKDRKDFMEFAVRLGRLEVEVKEMRHQVFKLPEQTKEKVSDAVEGITQETKDLKEEISKKRVIAFRAIKPWWKKIFGS